MARSIEEIENDIAMVEKAIKEIDARKEKREQFSPEQIAQMYSLDPKAAEFFANKQQAEKTLESKPTQVYTPEQKSLIDAKQQNRIRMGEAQSSYNIAKDETTKKYWKNQYEELRNNDIRLNNELVKLGTLGYSEIAPKQSNDGDDIGDGGENKITISPVENVETYSDYTKKYNPNNFKEASDVPTPSQIIADASSNNYSISKETADAIYKETVDVVTKRNNEEKDTDRIAYERNKDRLDNAINGWKSAVNDWKTIRNKAKSALINFKNANWGAAQTITMKALLGDALSEQERSVMSSKGYGASVFGGLWSKLTNSATPITKTEAEKVVKSLVDFVNSLSDDFKGFANNKYVLDGLGLSKSLLVPLTMNVDMNDGKPLLKQKPKTKTNPMGLDL